MSMRLLLIPLLAFAVSAQQSPDKPGRIRGQVTSISGDPVRKADVSLRSSGKGGTRGELPSAYVITTDASGVFSFENVSPGSYFLSARRNGFVRSDAQRRPGSPGLQGITVSAGQDISGITIKLTPQSVISGKVLDEEGEPVSATVQVLEERYFRGKRQLTARANSFVNDLGEYRVAGLQPGRYFVSVEPRAEFGPGNEIRQRSGGQETDRALVTTFYPGVFEQSQATPVNLEPGQEARGIDLQMRLAQTVHVRGHVLDETGSPASNIGVMVMPSDGVQGGMSRHGSPVRADGSFDVGGLAPGSYRLLAQRMSRDRGRSTGSISVQVGSRDVESVMIRLSSSVKVSGTIRTSEPVEVRSARVTLDPVDGLPFDMASSAPALDGASFVIDNVNVGRYRMDVFGAPDGYYLKSVQVSGQDVTDTGLSVTGATEGLEVLLAKGAATVEGTITDAEGKPVASGLVALVPPSGKRDQYRLFKTSMSDQTGKFAIRNLPPAEYTLFAFSPAGDASAVQNPEYLRQLESKGSVVKLGESAKESVQLKIIE